MILLWVLKRTFFLRFLYACLFFECLIVEFVGLHEFLIYVGCVWFAGVACVDLGFMLLR